jgi:1-acyl-sn-glycerol-3-phosphate acyltransferase
LGEFRPGIERIVERTLVPVIPIALCGLWGSFFSRKDGDAMSRPLRLITRLHSTIKLVVGDAVCPEAVRADDLRDRVLALRGELR